MKNVVKKLNWVLQNVTCKIWTKSIRPMVCALNDCFCRQKAKMNFTQSMVFAEGLYAITITLHIAQLCLLLSNRSNTGLVKLGNIKENNQKFSISLTTFEVRRYFGNFLSQLTFFS
jgi:hypothetical protein